MIKEIMEAVSIPVMAKVRIGHIVEAQILQAVGVDYIDVRHSPLKRFTLVDTDNLCLGIRGSHSCWRSTPHR